MYKYHKNSGNKYSCSSCKSPGKNRSVTVIDGRIVGRKHPEDDHLVDCLSVCSTFVDVVAMDHQMRSDVKTTGKRPREAYMTTISAIPQKFSLRRSKQLLSSTFLHLIPSVDHCIGIGTQRAQPQQTRATFLMTSASLFEERNFRNETNVTTRGCSYIPAPMGTCFAPISNSASYIRWGT